MTFFKTRPHIRKIISTTITIAFLGNFILPTPALAQVLNLPSGPAGLPAPGTMLSLTPQFTPPILKGLEINPDNPLQFNFFVNSGEDHLKNSSSTS